MSDEEPGVLPCNECGGPAPEYTVPNEAWNTIIRHENPEGPGEYICLNCFANIAAESVRGLTTATTQLVTDVLTKTKELRDLSDLCVKLKAELDNVRKCCIYGFYENGYPEYSNEWRHELQTPATPSELNAIVNRLRKLSELGHEMRAALPEDSPEARKWDQIGVKVKVPLIAADVEARLKAMRRERDEP